MHVKGFIRQKSLFSNSEDKEGSLSYSVSKNCLYIGSRGVKKSKKSFFFDRTEVLQNFRYNPYNWMLLTVFYGYLFTANA